MKRLLFIFLVGVLQLRTQSQTSQSINGEKEFKIDIQKKRNLIDKQTKGCGFNLYDSLEYIQVYFYNTKEFSLRVTIKDNRSDMYRHIYFFKENPIYEEIRTKESKVFIYFDRGEFRYFENGQGNGTSIQNILVDKQTEKERIEVLKSRIKSNFY